MSASRPGRLAVASGLIAALAALPLAITAPAPLQDWPSHLARVRIMDEMLDGAGPWAVFYELRSFLIPNIALDLGVLGLVRCGLGLEAAGTVFLLLTYTGFVTGFVRLSAAFGAGGAVKPLLGATLFYSAALFWGFVNYVAGTGALLWVVALWLRADRVGARFAVAVLGTAAAFACHVIPAFLVVGVLGCLDLHALARGAPRRSWRHLTSPAAAATVLLLLAASPTSGDGLLSVSYFGAGSALAVAEWKALLFAQALLHGGLWADAALVVLGLALASAGLFAAQVTLVPAARPVVLALVLLALAAPEKVGTGSLFDYRLGVMPLVVAAAGVRLSWRRHAGPALVFAAAALLAVVRSAALAVAWHDAGRTYAEADAAFAGLPRGGLLLTAFGRLPAQLGFMEWWTPPIAHVDALAVRYGVFVPSVAAFAAQQPLVLRPGYSALNRTADADTPERWAQALGQARLLCPGSPGSLPFTAVSIIVLYPGAFMQAPGFQRISEKLALFDACAG